MSNDDMVTLYIPYFGDLDELRSHVGIEKDGEKKKESREHGVQGQKWGIVNPRTDTGKPRPKPDLQNDPRTLNMMHVVKRGQTQLNAIRVWQKNRAERLAQQNQPAPSHQQHHSEALEHLKELGWKVLETGAHLAGMGGAVGAISSIVRSPAGQRLLMKTDGAGSHSIGSGRVLGRGSRRRESKVFESRMGTFLREAGGTYYARSMEQYGTDRESDDIDLIKESFGGGVNSPKTKRHAELGMGYFHKKIDAAKRVVIRPRKKNRVTAGVFSEATHALKNKIPVYAIREGKLRRVSRVEALDNPNNQGHFGKLVFRKKKKG